MSTWAVFPRNGLSYIVKRWTRKKRSISKKNKRPLTGSFRPCSHEISLDGAIALGRDVKQPVNVLLKGSEIILPEKPARKFQQSPETKKKFVQWRNELDDKSYRKMVENVTAQSRMNENRDHREIKSFRDQLGIAINLVVTRLALLVAGWWLGHRAFGAAWGPVVGIICMTIGLFAEIGIYMIKARRLDATLLQRDEREKLSFPGASLAQSQLNSTQTREQILDAR